MPCKQCELKQDFRHTSHIAFELRLPSLHLKGRGGVMRMLEDWFVLFAFSLLLFFFSFSFKCPLLKKVEVREKKTNNNNKPVVQDG